jgi:hypothetical protein
VANPSSRGSRTECGANLVTRTTGARTAADCGEAGGLLLVAKGLAMQGGRGQGAMGGISLQGFEPLPGGEGVPVKGLGASLQT